MCSLLRCARKRNKKMKPQHPSDGKNARMPEGAQCPICLDQAVASTTPCGHGFCNRCLDQWKERQTSCPLCRSPLSAPTAHPEAAMTSRPVDTSSRRYAIEREHQERLSRRDRQVALERRLDQYRSSIWTPSGRPYEDLPVVSLNTLRNEIFKANARSLAIGASSLTTWR